MIGNIENGDEYDLKTGVRRYKGTDKLGEGTYGVVYKAVSDHNNETVAIKKIRLENEDELSFAPRRFAPLRAVELAEALSARFQRLTGEAGRVLFTTGGSDAVEGALKIARQYHKLRGEKDRTKFIALRQGYHGVHFGGMSVNGNTNFRRPYEPLLPGCFHIDSPWLYRNPWTRDTGPEAEAELGRQTAAALEREIVFQGPDTVAAFIAEPVMGAGGVMVGSKGHWASNGAVSRP